jgi:lipoprotein-anchoring transpeptidase ErfK/SrfK
VGASGSKLGARRAVAPLVLAVLALLVGLLSACATSAAAPAPAPTAPPAPPQVTLSPADGAAGVAPADPITIRSVGGALTGVTLTAADGTAIPGTLASDGLTWTATAPPAYATAYHFSGTATGAGGAVPVGGSFTTADPARLVHVSTNIGDGAVVGVAAPIEIRFDRKIAPADRAAAERALKVTTSVPVEGAWGWLPDGPDGSRVHWRPAAYWPSGTAVTVAAHLYGVDLGKAGFGAKNLDSAFTIGRSQIIRADATTHRMVVVRDGQVVSDLPASYGADSDARRVTRSGVHIVMSKSQTVLMSNPAFDYEDVPMHWAVRISNNGEFIHANPASNSAQGKRNITHGCINLSTANAKAYYDTAIFGDPVEITGTRVPLSAADGDVYDWAIPYDQWKAMSALA